MQRICDKSIKIEYTDIYISGCFRHAVLNIFEFVSKLVGMPEVMPEVIFP
jgi:hypothetical protein